ncbi:MAG: ABC transporter permease [Clostridia bacterium]|nr:ABC transporter permease [Clostridia bacterium]
MVKKLLSNSYLALVLLFIYTPILFVMIFSFTESGVMGNWQGFSSNLYKELFQGEQGRKILQVFWNTIKVGLIAAVVSTVLGSIGAIGIFYSGRKMRKTFSFINQIPVVNAEIVTGISLLLLFLVFALPRGEVTVILAHITFCTPYVVLSVLPKLKQMNNNIYEACLDLGATPLRALWSVILPEILPGMISGFIMAFTLSIDDFVVTNYTTSTSFDTLSTFIYKDAVKGGLTPSLRALSTLIFVVVLTMLFISNFRASKEKTKEKKA